MKKIFQRIVHKGKGDCSRAAIASMLELPLDAVPHFNLNGNLFYYVMIKYLEAHGYECHYVNISRKERRKDKSRYPTRKHLVNGCIYGVVKSRTFKNTLHAVLINSAGTVIHDPNPNRAWIGVNVIKTGELEAWNRIVKLKDRP